MFTVSAEWVVSPIIASVIDKIETYISNRFFQRAGIDDDMKKMETTLMEILSVMSAVEKQKIVEPNQVQLVRIIKDAVYDAEDVMDEFEYNLLNENSEKQSNIISRAGSSSLAFFGLTDSKEKFKKEVQLVMESLERAKVSTETLIRLVKSKSNNLHSYEYGNSFVTSSIISDQIIGREMERRYLIDLLVKQVDVLPTIIPIVGQGGIGKTTLAQMVFNDPRVNGYFDKTMWLSVSYNFDKVRLTKEMVKCVCENYSVLDVSFDMLQRKLENELARKRILLVLDDVWYERDETQELYGYKREWLEFFAPLKRVQEGSKIILTTRLDLVGRILGSVKSFSLGGLGEDDSWSLFQLCAFDCENQHKRQDLEPIGKMIVNRLRGSTLAIRVVGGQLRGNADAEDWIRVLNDNPLDTIDIMNILYRSYEHLPEHLKHCFAYCSLFPKDYRLKPDRLIQMWIAQGFVRSQAGKKLEEVGRAYFDSLLARSFIQVIKRGYKEYYVMHDFMNDLACHISKGEYYILGKGDSVENLGSIRHLSITPEAVDTLGHMQGLDKLRTLMLINFTTFSKNPVAAVVAKLRRIRVLDIEWRLPILPNISGLKHLRYLSFRKSLGVNWIPDFFNKLHNLRVVFIRTDLPNRKNFYYDLCLPECMYNLSNLVLVDTSKSCVVDLRKLAGLQNIWKGGSSRVHFDARVYLLDVILGTHSPLDFFGIKGHGLDVLENVTKIKGLLEINGLENAIKREDAVKAQLGRKKYITALRLNWSTPYAKVKGGKPLITALRLNWSTPHAKVKGGKPHEVLEALSPNPCVERLFIYGYPGLVCPSWLESNLLSQIREITLHECNGLKMLPSLGQLPLLKRLKIIGLDAVRKIGLEFYGNGTFPSLEELHIDNLKGLEEWSLPCDLYVFPRLTKLEIKECEQLVALNGLHELATIEKFLIFNCPSLSSLPEMVSFYSLKYLAILNCQGLKSLPKKGLPVSLHAICISRTHHLLEEQILSKKGRDWDKLAAISGCDCFSPQNKGTPQFEKVVEIILNSISCSKEELERCMGGYKLRKMYTVPPN